MLKDVDFDDAHFKRVEAIILSMTAHERQRPDVIDLPRRRRIAAGSGNPLDAVHGLIKQFKTMQDLMKRLGKGGGGMPPDLGALLGGGGGPGMGGGRRGGGFPGGFPGGRGFPGRRGR
jgi:signal recognition particle subunit SRP54